MRTDTIIKYEGFHALAEKLDLVEIERFIMLVNKEKYDYTNWRKTLFENISVEELSNKAMNYINQNK
jgi:hypothetical protein